MIIDHYTRPAMTYHQRKVHATARQYSIGTKSTYAHCSVIRCLRWVGVFHPGSDNYIYSGC